MTSVTAALLAEFLTQIFLPCFKVPSIVGGPTSVGGVTVSREDPTECRRGRYWKALIRPESCGTLMEHGGAVVRKLNTRFPLWRDVPSGGVFYVASISPPTHSDIFNN